MALRENTDISARFGCAASRVIVYGVCALAETQALADDQHEQLLDAILDAISAATRSGQ